MLKRILISAGVIAGALTSGPASAAYNFVSCTGLSNFPGGCRENYLPTIESGQFSMQGYYIWPSAAAQSIVLHNTSTGVNTFHPVSNASGSGYVDALNTANFGSWDWTGQITVSGAVIQLTLKMRDRPNQVDYWETCATNLTNGVTYPCERWGE